MRLVLMRHGDALAATPPSTDHARPLSALGVLQAREVGGVLAARGWIPDRVLCSDARRTRETWDRVSTAFGRDLPVHFLHAFYGRGITAVPAALPHVAERAVLVIGHNPDWSHLVGEFTGESASLGTANAALIEVDATDWSAAIDLSGAWTLVDIVRPIA